MLHGAHTLLKSEDEHAISDEPIWLSATMIDIAIARGNLKAGSLDGIVVQPPRAEWPEEWRFLQTKE
jgi:hypothetical protein